MTTYKNRFEYLNANTSLSIDYNDITYNYVKKYLSYKWYGKIIGLSVYYFPLFEAKLAQYGLPLELKYLAVVESALNPRAGSWAGAKGLWQFMPATGTQMGIKQNNYINIFFDPVGNTDAAARYLKSLYKEFGDWNLAISAYNCVQEPVISSIFLRYKDNHKKFCSLVIDFSYYRSLSGEPFFPFQKKTLSSVWK